MLDPDKTNQTSESSGFSVWLVGFVCIAGPALASLIPMAAAPAMPAMAAQFSGSGDGQFFAQMVMTIPAVLLIIAAPLTGVLSSFIGRRMILLTSLVLYIVGGAGVLVVNDQSVLIILRLLLGAAGGGILAVCLALIGDCFSGRQREKILGFAISAASLVSGLALIFGGSLVDLGGWRFPFALYLLALPVLVVAFISVPSELGVVARESVVKQTGGAGSLLRVSHYYFLLVLLTLGMFTPAIQVPFVLEAKGMTSGTLIGTVISATSFVAMISAGFFGWLRKWIAVQGFLAINAVSMGAGILLIALSPNIVGIFFGCALIGIGAGMSEPTIASIVFDRTPIWVHGLAMGLIVSALYLGQFVNPIVFAPLRMKYGVSASFLIIGIVLSVIGLAIIVRNANRLLEKSSGQVKERQN